MSQTWSVYVDDNFRYQDPEERYTLGTFDTAEEALAACRQVVERSLRHILTHEPDLTAAELASQYRAFGKDPWISPRVGDFVAWDYAEALSIELTAKGGG